MLSHLRILWYHRQREQQVLSDEIVNIDLIPLIGLDEIITVFFGDPVEVSVCVFFTDECGGCRLEVCVRTGRADLIIGV